MMTWLLLFMLLLPSLADAATYHVSASGSNAFTCTQAQSQATPKADPMNTMACLASGDTMWIHGVISGANAMVREGVNLLANGTAAAPTIIKGDGVGVTILRPSTNGTNIDAPVYITFQDLTIDHVNLGTDEAGIRLAGTGHHFVADRIRITNAARGSGGPAGGFLSVAGVTEVTLRNSEFDHNGCAACNAGHGFYIQGNNGLVEFVHSHHNERGCGQIFDVASGGIMRYNIVHDCDFGLAANGNHQIYGNLVYNITQLYGIGLFATGASVWNNTVYNAVGAGIDCGVSGGSGSCNISNNLTVGNTSGGMRFGAGWTNNGTGSSNITTGLITDYTVSTSDFHLKIGTNAAVDTGITIATVTRDLDAVVRPQGAAYDIGAYERPGSAVDTTPPATPTGLSVQ